MPTWLADLHGQEGGSILIVYPFTTLCRSFVRLISLPNMRDRLCFCVCVCVCVFVCVIQLVHLLIIQVRSVLDSASSSPTFVV